MKRLMVVTLFFREQYYPLTESLYFSDINFDVFGEEIRNRFKLINHDPLLGMYTQTDRTSIAIG